MEVKMSSTDVSAETATATAPPPKPGEMKLEVVQVPVSDIDRAKEFYASLGWREDADFDISEDFRVVQFTPPGSGCSIGFGKGLTTMKPGSVQRLEVAVNDIVATREDLISRGVEVGEVYHSAPGEEPGSGPDPERRSYSSYASFEDPDGNSWLLQEITERLPGRG
jgi:catechol 2,3-dioxygenase-like lactoylglutathione lyase family enzyme